MVPPNRWQAGYTLIEVIGVVVVTAILLAAAVPAVGHALRVRQAEAVLKNDLHHAANAYEEAYVADRAYPDFPGLQARGFRLSPSIEVDSQAVNGERVYLRLRHLGTGQLCVLDYSRSSAVARNRADCYGGGLERDTALVLTAEPPAAPPTDTFGIVPPPPVTGNPLALADPEVDNPGDQSGPPGVTRSQTFTVTNRSPVTRTFRLEVGSSDPATVPSPGGIPSELTLLPNVPTPVGVTYTVAADALANASAVVPLRVVDDGDDRWGGTGSFTFTTELALAAPVVAVDGPPERVEDAGVPFDLSWTVTNRSNAARVVAISVTPGSPDHAEVLALGGAGRVPMAPGQTRSVTARVRLAAGSDGGTRSTVHLDAADADVPGYSAAAGVGVETRTVLLPPSITAPAGRAANPGSAVTLTWTVRNESNLARSLQLVAGVEDADHLEIVGSSGTGVRAARRGEVLTASVTYRIKPGAVAGSTSMATLQVTDHAAPAYEATATAAILTNTALADPTVTAPGARVGKPGEEFTVTWTVRNGTNAQRVLAIDPPVPGGSDLSLVGVLGAGNVWFGPFETRSVTATWRVSATSLAGSRSSPRLAVRDAGAPAYRGEAGFDFTTAADYRDPSLSPPADRTGDPGTASGGTFRLVNRSNAARVFTLAATSSNTGAASDPVDPGPVTVPAFGMVDVPVAAVVQPAAVGYSQAAIALRATDSQLPVHVGTAQFVVTVNPVYLAPALSWSGASRTVRPGSTATDSAVLVNRSNVPLEFCFSSGVADGNVGSGLVVASSPPAPPCRMLGPAGSASGQAKVGVSYESAAEALAGWSNVVSLGVEQRSPVPFAAAAGLPVTAELVLANPTWVGLPTSPMFWDEGEVRPLTYTLRNESNGPRSFCVAVTSADPRVVAPVGASPICGIRVEPRDTVRIEHATRAAGPGTGVRVTAEVYDESDPSFRAEGGFHNVVRATRPTAVWDAPAPVYVRRWATFDGSRSWSPVGSPIVRYIWTWGLVMQRWDPDLGRFVYTGEWGTARDEVTTPVVERAYDYQGTFQVCLTVVDVEGRSSDPNCQPITTLRATVARLAWRFRGWWTYKDWCLDVWWSDQCDPEHGNARWEIDLRPSIGDVPIKAANASFRVRLHNTDDPDRNSTVTYTGNGGTIPGWGSYSFGTDAPEAVGKPQDGRWRALSTVGTGAQGWPTGAALGDHPLVLNVNLASATGVFDGGPHVVPDEVWITLNVQDADDRWTSITAYRNHDKGAWERAYDTTVVAEARPSTSITVDSIGEDRYRATGDAESAAGRIVDRWWEVRYVDLTNAVGQWTRSERGPTIEIAPRHCEKVIVTFHAKDDLGVVDSSVTVLWRPGEGTCGGPGGGPLQ